MDATKPIHGVEEPAPLKTISSEPREAGDCLRWQAYWCERLGSPLYAELLRRAADDYGRRGVVWRVLRRYEDLPAGSALGLRLLGAIHRLALTGEAPAVARFYPSCGGVADAGGAWDAIGELIAARTAKVSRLLDRPVQTNEVGRSGALLGGFLLVAQETGLPLAVLEIGASAGLNLRWDRYRYEAGDSAWGDPGSPVKLSPFVVAPPLSVTANVVERRGCDAQPVDATTNDGRVTLMSYVWADQIKRLHVLKAALEVAARVPAAIERSDALEWTREQLIKRRSGVAAVVFHSVVWQYLSDAQRVGLQEAIEGAGQEATASAPLAWLSFEPGEESFDVRLRAWPGGTDRLLARARAHGDAVHWVL